MNVEWSASAIADLDRFAAFLKSRFPTMARTVAQEIVGKVDRLVETPELGRPLSGHRDRRQIVVRVLNASYIVQYRLAADRLVVLRVFHGRESRAPEAIRAGGLRFRNTPNEGRAGCPAFAFAVSVGR